MMSIQIQDCNQLIKFSIEELKAVQTVMVMAEDHPVYSNAHETLIVTRRAMEAIIADLEEVVGIIDGEMENVQKD